MRHIIKQKINHFKYKGTVTPSSKYLVTRLISKIDFSKSKKIVQLGFGTGVFSKKIVELMTDDAELYIFEIDKESKKHFDNMISKKNVKYYQLNANEINSILKDGSVDCIISTLPLMSLPEKLVDKILNSCVKVLRKEGLFFQYQYSLFSRKKIESIFGNRSEIHFELFNIPPAFIYMIKRKIL